MTRRRVTLVVNGNRRELDVEPRTLLLDALRDALLLTGAHAACEQGSCGACTVLLDGAVARACLMFAVQAEGHEVTTVEGIGTPERLHPVQQALADTHGVQCGFCTPGVVLTAVELLQRQPHPTRAEIERAMAGNLCRCTGYVSIVDAIEKVAAAEPLVSNLDEPQDVLR